MAFLKSKIFIALWGITLNFLSGVVFANSESAETALANLMSDIEKVQTKNKDNKESIDHYKTQYGDTLDQIIIDYMPNLPIRTSMLKRAIVFANPHAFKRSNPNWMYAGKRLRLPGAKDIHNVVFTERADTQASQRDAKLSWVKYP